MDGALKTVLSRDEARYFATLVDEATGHVRTFHLEAKGEAAEHLKHQTNWFEGKY